MSIFKLPSFLKRKHPEPEEEQNHSSDLGRSGSAKEVGKPILAEDTEDANSQGQEVPVHDGRPKSRRRRKKAQKGNEQG